MARALSPLRAWACRCRVGRWRSLLSPLYFPLTRDLSKRNSSRDSSRYFTSAANGSPRFTSARAQPCRIRAVSISWSSLWRVVNITASVLSCAFRRFASATLPRGGQFRLGHCDHPSALSVTTPAHDPQARKRLTRQPWVDPFRTIRKVLNEDAYGVALPDNLHRSMMGQWWRCDLKYGVLRYRRRETGGDGDSHS
jgi:hypothetical protein